MKTRASNGVRVQLVAAQYDRLAPFQSLYGEVPHAPASLIHGPQPRCHSATVFAEGLMSSQLAARDTIRQANSLFRERHAQARRGHTYREGEEVLLSTEHLSLRGEHPKFFPMMIVLLL